MKKIILLMLLSAIISFAFAAQHDYNPVDSPGQDDYDSNTYTENGWTDIIVSQTDEIIGVQVNYTWITDSYAYEGSFHMESPSGTTSEIASGQTSGTYSVDLSQFDGESMNGTWKLWIEDSYGDGGHRATNITVSFMYNPPGTPDPASNPNPANNAIGIPINGSLTWDFGAATDTYDLWFGPAGNMTEVVTGAVAGVSGSYDYTNLAGTSQYTWQVITYNSSSGLSNMSPVWSFQSEILPVTIFPYIEDFDGDWTGSPAAPLGWTVINADGDSYLWTQANTYISPTHSGSYAAHGMGNTDDYLITPPIDLSDINARISWWDKVESVSYPNSYKVLLSTTDPDIESFTVELGDFTCTNTAWIEHNINLSEYNGQTVYIAFYQYASDSTYWGFGIDDVKIDIILPSPPEPATVAWPLDGMTTFVDPLLRWTPSATGEPALSYKVYLNQTGIFTEGDLVYEGTALQYQTTGISADRSYYWKVEPTNNYGSDPSCPTWSFNTPGPDQLAESFEISWPPAGWVNSGSWSRNSTYKVEGSYSASRSGSSSTQYLLRTPLVSIDAGSSLQFGAAGSSASASLEIVYSADGTDWTQIGDTITYAQTYTFFPQVIDLSALPAGDYYLGFRNGLTTGTNYIDHIIGPDLAPVAPGIPSLSSPADNAQNLSQMPALSWSAPTDGGVVTGYHIYLDTNIDPVTLIGSSLGTSYTLSTALDYSETYYWKVVAYNNALEGEASLVRSFTVMDDPTIYVNADNPWLEDFNTTPFPPLNWSQGMGELAETTTITSGTNWNHHNFGNTGGSSNAAYINVYSEIKHWLFTPQIDLSSDASLQLELDIALTPWTGTAQTTLGANDYVAVVISLDGGETWSTDNVLLEWDASSEILPTGNHHIADLSSYSGLVQLGFYAQRIPSSTTPDLRFYVDNVLIRETPAAPIFSHSPAALDFGSVMFGVDSNPQNLTVTNTGGSTLRLYEEDISITGLNSADFAFGIDNLPAALEAGESVQIPVTVNPATEGEISATLVINYDGQDYEIPLTGEVLPEGTLVIGDGTANDRLPINAYYGYTYSQSIFLQPELDREDQRIVNIAYHWNGAGAGNNSNLWTVYMGHTDLSEFAGTTDWLPLSELTQVFSGSLEIPAENTWIQIPLQVPFEYNNVDNLVIAVDENRPSYNISSSFFFNTTTATSRSIHYYSDVTNPDPASPPTGTLISAIPNIQMMFTDIPTGPPLPVSLLSPEDGATGMPMNGFDLSWAWDSFGTTPTHYTLYLGQRLDNLTDAANAIYDVTNTSFNPVVEGGVDFAYGETWYWTVEAHNLEGNTVQETAYSFTIEPDPTVTNYPYLVDFEDHADNSLPNGWRRSSNSIGWLIGDDLGSYSFSIPSHTVYAASNDDAAGSSADSGVDFLISAPLDLSGDHEGVPVLSFASYYTGSFSQLATVQIRYGNHDWENLFVVPTATSWTTYYIGLVEYQNYNNVQIRFWADDNGAWASGWAIDDFEVSFMDIDAIPPTIAHVPLMNTGSPDPYMISAEIADDATWNSGIAEARVFYRINGGNYSSVPMTATDRSSYAGYIPGQTNGSLIEYYIQAVDASLISNTKSSPTYQFLVDYPTWLYYAQGSTSALLYPTQTYGVLTRFDNPYQDDPARVNIVQGATQNSGPANIYVFDSELQAVAGPFPITFTGGQMNTFDLSAHNIVVDSPEFYIGFMNIVNPNYFYLDQDRNMYPNTHFLTDDTGNMMELGSIGYAGSWLISCMIDRPIEIAATLQGTGILLSWTEVPESPHYNLYAADSPYSESWDLLQSGLSTNGFQYTPTDAMKFFRITVGSISTQQVTQREAQLNTHFKSIESRLADPANRARRKLQY